MKTNLELEYSPSHWTTRFSSGDEVLKNHLNFVENESNIVRDSIEYRTIAYGTGENEKFDEYGINLNDDSPIFIFIHGGYWQWLHKDQSAYMVQPLFNAGYKVFVLEYDLCPDISLENLILQVGKAGRYIFDYCKNAKFISIGGHSAGAHLTVCLYNELLKTKNCLSRIKHLYLISGVYDLSQLRYTSEVNENNKLSIFDNNVHELLSPMYFDFKIWQKYPLNIKIYVAENDSITFRIQSECFWKRLKRDFNLNCQFKLIDECDHFDIVENLSKNSYEITKEIIRNLNVL